MVIYKKITKIKMESSNDNVIDINNLNKDLLIKLYPQHLMEWIIINYGDKYW